MLFWAIVFIAAAVVLYAVIMFNSLVRTRQMANEAWSGIDVQLKRRSELVPNLVESVKGYATHERSVLEEVTRLRSAAREVPADDVAGRAAERALTTAIGKLVALAENYPAPKASANFRIAARVEQPRGRIADGAPLLQRDGAKSERSGAVVSRQPGRRGLRLRAARIFRVVGRSRARGAAGRVARAVSLTG
jgi:hypothetical protein